MPKIYCNMTDCQGNANGKCSVPAISLGSDGFCLDYLKEEIPAYANPDCERDIKE